MGHIQKKSIPRRDAKLSLEKARDLVDGRLPTGGRGNGNGSRQHQTTKLTAGQTVMIVTGASRAAAEKPVAAGERADSEQLLLELAERLRGERLRHFLHRFPDYRRVDVPAGTRGWEPSSLLPPRANAVAKSALSGLCPPLSGGSERHPPQRSLPPGDLKPPGEFSGVAGPRAAPERGGAGTPPSVQRLPALLRSALRPFLSSLRSRRWRWPPGWWPWPGWWWCTRTRPGCTRG